MRKILILFFLGVVALLFVGCKLFYSIDPAADPIVGTWTLAQVTTGSTAWVSAAAAGDTGTLTVTSSGSWTETIDISGSTGTISGNWTDTSPGIYTIVVTADTLGGYGVDLITLSSDQKTLYSGSGSGGPSFQFTKT